MIMNGESVRIWQELVVIFLYHLYSEYLSRKLAHFYCVCSYRNV